MAKFSFVGQVRSGKNQMMIDPRSGRHYPAPLFSAWRDEQVLRIRQQKAQQKVFFAKETKLIFGVEYWPGDARRRDMPGIEDAIFHVLERAGVVEDDAQFEDCSGWYKQEIDRKNPRLEISIVEKIQPLILKSL